MQYAKITRSLITLHVIIGIQSFLWTKKFSCLSRLPAGRITDVVVFREFVLLLPLLVGPAVAQLGDGEVLLPVMSPVELALN